MMSKEEIKDLIYRVENEFNNELDFDYDYNGRELTDDDLNMIENAITNFATKLGMCVDDEDSNYRLVELRDSCDYENVIGAVYLNYKHSIQDFQNAINKAKEKRQDEIYEFGDDWSIISEELGNFDYFETDTNASEDYVIF